MADIAAAIDAVYRAFADVQRPSQVQACCCCLSDEQRKHLVTQPLRHLHPSHMSAYGSAVGRSPDQFFYFLPRHLEIAATDKEGWCPEPEVLGHTMAEMGVDACSITQKNAIDNLFKLIVHKALDPNHHSNIDPWMCCIAHAGFPVRHRLNTITRCRSAVLAYFNNNTTVMERKLSNLHWCLPNAGHEEIVNWFHSQPVRDILYEEYRLVW